MASAKDILICLALAVTLFAGGAAPCVSGTKVVEAENDALSLDPLDEFALDLLENDFAEEDALWETASVRELVPFIRDAFSTNQQSAGGLLLPKEEAIEFLEALQDVERFQDSFVEFDEKLAAATDADKSVAQQDQIAGAHNTSLVASVLTRLVSLATMKNKVSRKVSTVLNILTTIKKHATTVVKALKRVAALMEELQKLQSRLIDLTNKFVEFLEDTIELVKVQWQSTTRGTQKSAVLAFFQSLRKWAEAAKEASQRRWHLIQALFASAGKEGTQQQEFAEEVTTSDSLRAAKSARSAAAEGGADMATSPKHVASLDSLYSEAEEARRIERELAQTVWHQAAKCAQEGFLPLSFVRVLLGES